LPRLNLFYAHITLEKGIVVFIDPLKKTTVYSDWYMNYKPDFYYKSSNPYNLFLHPRFITESRMPEAIK
jgi:hypothetical protein